MGYCCRWIAVRGGDRAESLSRLRFSIIQELTAKVHDPGLHAVDLPGWFVVLGDGSELIDLLERSQAERLSKYSEVIFFYTDDSAMYAEVTSYVGGQTSWSVSYDGSDGIGSAIIDGAVPESARSILAAALDEQGASGGTEADVDCIYEAMAELGRTLVGVRHDRTLRSGQHLPIYRLTTLDRIGAAPQETEPRTADRSALLPDAALAAAKKVLGPRALEAVVNDVGVVELHLVVRAVTPPLEPGDIAIDRLRAEGVEADEGDELLFPFYYLPEDEGRASDQRRSGIATLLEIPSDAFDAMQRELGRAKTRSVQET